MQLKSLELSGFKSFAKKTRVDFMPGVTAVVGPNGSGKSNIVDALRWVLAEQALKNLRGKKGEDFIFHGSSARSSLPRAKVELTLANSQGESFFDAEEIVISREVTRKGDNSYKINGRAVRLMDVEDFLSRSKVGSSSFRILSQGMSDLLLTLGPQELRTYIEEAAGLKEFQDSKERSQKKMELTRDNIVKVEAMLGEIEPQLSFLKREVGKYAKRADIEAELKKEALSYFSLKHSELVRREREAHDEKKRLTAAISEAEKNIQKNKSNSGAEVSLSAHSQLQKARAKDHELSRQIIRLEGQLEVEKAAAKRLLPVTQEYISSVVSSLLGVISAKETNALDKIKEGLERLKTELQKGRAPQDNSSEIKKIANELTQVRQKQKEEADIIRALEKNAEEEMKNIEQARKSMAEREGEYRKAYDELRTHERALAQTELEEEKILVRREQFNHDLNTIGAVKLSEITEVVSEPKEDVEALNSKMWSLKKKLDQVGTIDPAIEKEYGAVKERYDFLAKEHTDLLQALEQLSQMIEELEAEIKTRFSSALTGVSSAFNQNISLMFGGGAGKVSLVQILDSEDEDERGINIEIDLPNKKVKKLGMLSGGERTLVSIALLFALVNIRKPPFLVLDEIDAALDEANSQKFISLVRTRSSDTQFVIITHNRETMRGADAIYGVSMKDGISQLLSLKLEKAEEVSQK